MGRYLTEVDDFASNFDTVLNAVDDLGMDPNGNEVIDDTLDANFNSNTLIEFPAGTYAIENLSSSGSIRYPTHWGSPNWFGMKGLGNTPQDVTFRLEQQGPEEGGRWFNFDGSTGVMFKNFAIDYTDDDVTSTDLVFNVHDDLLVEDVYWAGVTPSEPSMTGQMIAVHILDQSGLGELNNVVAQEGDVQPGYPDGAAAIRQGPSHVGDLRLVNSHFENRGSSATRSTNNDGVLIIEDSFFRNNSNNSIRFGAGDHPDKVSKAVNCRVEMDINNLNQYAVSAPTSGSALTVDSTGNGYTGAVFKDIDVVWKEAPDKSAILERPDWGEHGEFLMQHVRVQNDTDSPTTLFDAVPTNPDDAVLDNCHVTGSGSGGLMLGSDGVLKNSCVQDNFPIDDGWKVKNLTNSSCEVPGDSSGGDDDEQEDSTSPPGYHVELVTFSGGPVVDYVLHVSGDVEPGPEGGDFDNIVSHGDGTSTIVGVSSDGGVDDWYVDGNVLGFESSTSSENYDLLLDGTNVSELDLVKKAGNQSAVFAVSVGDIPIGTLYTIRKMLQN